MATKRTMRIAVEVVEPDVPDMEAFREKLAKALLDLLRQHGLTLYLDDDDNECVKFFSRLLRDWQH